MKNNRKVFSTTPELLNNYEIEVRNRFQLLQEDEDLTARYERFVQANEDAKQKVVSVRKKEKPVYCSDHPDVKCARVAISEAYDLLSETHSPENRNRVIEAKDHLYQLYERLKAEE